MIKRYLFIFIILFLSLGTAFSSNNFDVKFFSSDDVLNKSLDINLLKYNSFYIDNYGVNINYKNKKILVSVFSDYDFNSYKIPIKNINSSNVDFDFYIKGSKVNLNLKNLDDFIKLKNESSFNFFNDDLKNALLNKPFFEDDKLDVILKFNNLYYNQLNKPNFRINDVGDLDYNFLNKSSGFDLKVLNKNKKVLLNDLNKFQIQRGSGDLMSNMDTIKNNFDLYGGVESHLTIDEINFLLSLNYIDRIDINKKLKILDENVKNTIGSSIVNNFNSPLGGKLNGAGVVVAVIDTGVDYTHSDFGDCTTSKYLDNVCNHFVLGHDFVNSDNDPIDDQGHGTHVAGIIGANGTVKGIAPGVKIMPIKVLNSLGSGDLSDVISGVEFAMDPNGDGDLSDAADIISMSLGASGTSDDPISTISNLAVSRGIVVVVAAGNSGPYLSTIKSPGLAKNVITVGASCMNFQVNNSNYCYNSNVAQFSSRGPSPESSSLKPEVVAPGVDICSTKYSGFSEGTSCVDSNHVALSGTSMATPVVSGLVALLKQADPTITPNEIKSILMDSATDLNESIYSQGKGQVNAIGAYNMLGLNQDFSVDTSYIFYEDKFNVGFFEKNITVKNLNSNQITINLNLSNFENNANYYFIGNISKHNLTLGVGESKSFLFFVNTTNLNGVYSGNINLNSSNSSWIIPVSLAKYAYINLSLIDGVNGNDFKPDFVYLFNGKLAKSFNQVGDLKDKYSLKTDIGNYTIFVMGQDNDYGYKYLLNKDINVSSSGNYNVEMNMNESREYNVKGTSFDNNDLKTYEYNFGFYAYDNLSNVYLKGIINDYDNYYGDQKVRVSNKPKNIDNVDIILKYEAVEGSKE